MSDSKIPSGKPGLPPSWSPAAKQGIGTARNDISKVWFTIANGIITEVFYPTIDTANTKDLQLLITDGKTFVDEERKDTASAIEYLDPKALAYRITNTAKNGRYRITKYIVTDPFGQSLVVRTSFQVLQGNPEDYHLFILLAPHVKNKGYGNSGRCIQYSGRDYLTAWREDIALALTADKPFKNMSCGYSGFSDGWQDLKDNLRMDWSFHAVKDGNIAMMAEVSFPDFTIVLSFARNPGEAMVEAEKTLTRGYKSIEVEYRKGWHEYLSTLKDFTREGFDNGRLYWISAMVLKAHEDKTYKGGVIASLSIPWGEARGDIDSGGYHLVWPRDLVKAAFGFMAMGDMDTPVRIVKFLERTQKHDGLWPQNMWLDGRPYWTGIQLDQVAFPVILAWRLKNMGVLDEDYYPMVKRATSFLLREGPITEQERWEENSGFSPSTLAAEIAALICAAHWAKERGEHKESLYLFEIADYWQTKLEDWTFTNCGCLLPEHPEHYQRIAAITPDAMDRSGRECEAFIPIKNLPEGGVHIRSQCAIMDGGFLELVRYGIRGPKDVHILKTIPVIDSLLKTDTPYGPAWRRYNYDGYGEKEDGSPFDGSGVGRGWPLLTGERGMYEFLAGKDLSPYIKAMEGFANDGGLLPEQVWDTDDIPEKGLLKGKGTGSATPLVWAHAEYIKLLRSKRDCMGCDIIDKVYERYVVKGVKSNLTAWKRNKTIKRAMETLRIVTHEPAILHWSKDGWKTVKDNELMDSGLGVFYTDIPIGTVHPGDIVIFTFYYPIEDEWEGRDYRIAAE
ncbi:MAG: glucan 1,4-alpha-glucosidase [Deltaproteobacteria bacterium]|nr:glucan 1,4-alpha-glucosidase [Deltaproteobacteria bacterium]